METIIATKHLTKRYKDLSAVNDVSFEVEKGELLAVLGKNGAGKSTTLLMLLGLVKPTSGNILILNKQPHERAVKERIGVMLQEVSVIDALSVKEVLLMLSSYYENPLRLEEVLEITGIPIEMLKKKAYKLSGGQKRRLNFALAIISNPQIIFLDEPTVGMDSTVRRKFWQAIQYLNDEGKTVIFTTHYLQEADDVAKRIMLFNQGKVIADGTPLQLKSHLSDGAISFKSDQVDISLLQTFSHVISAKITDQRIVLTTSSTDALLGELFEKKVVMRDIHLHRARLEDAFELLTVERGNSE